MRGEARDDDPPLGAPEHLVDRGGDVPLRGGEPGHLGIRGVGVKELDNGFEVDIDLPGFKKDEIRLQLENGYLTVNAAKGLDKDEQDKKGRYVRRERYAGSMSRSFYVGDHVTEKDIHPKYENGIFKILCSEGREETN